MTIPYSKLTIFSMMALAESEDDLRNRTPDGCTVLCSRESGNDTVRKQNFLNADIVLGNPPPSWLNETKRLRWMQLESAGYDTYLRNAHEPWSRQVIVTNLKGFFGPPVAETLLAGVLALQRRVPDLLVLQAQSTWDRERIRPAVRIIHGAHAIILGAGSIGLHLQQVLHGLGASTSLFARSARQAELRTLSNLEEALPHADFVFGCLPDSASTAGLMNLKRLSLMKRGAVFANGGRGSLVDESALVAMLQRGELGGAVLDVTSVEPLPQTHPLWRCPNVILTQHTGGGFIGEVSGKTDFFLANLDRYRRGESLLNVVDFSTRD